MIIVEDGTGVEGANTYITLQEAEEYVADYIMDLSAWNDESRQSEKTAALLSSAKILDYLYKANGKKLNSKQGLQFPQVGATDVNGDDIIGVPEQVKIAQAMIMYDYFTGVFTAGIDDKETIKKIAIGSIVIEYDKLEKYKNMIVAGLMYGITIKLSAYIEIARW